MNGPAYYNENDAYAAAWLRNLIEAGHIAPGDVDERSIVDVRPDDLSGYVQCHFFAGIGGWSEALHIAGWPDDRPVWTGSCPCQPFSAAGKGKAADDERHLWPVWFPLIAQRKPPVVFGEQVEAAVGWGWLDAVFADLEAEGYACGATVLPACGVGAPHIRQRTWFVADTDGGLAGNRDLQPRRQHGQQPQDGRIGELADRDKAGRGEQRSAGLLDRERAAQWHDANGCRPDGGLAHPLRRGTGHGPGEGIREEAQAFGIDGRLPREGGGAGVDGADRIILGHAASDRWGEGVRTIGCPPPAGSRTRYGAGAGESFWAGLQWLPCTDGKARPTQPGLFPLAHGVPARVGKLRAYGNAIVPQAAAAFIGAFLDAEAM